MQQDLLNFDDVIKKLFRRKCSNKKVSKKRLRDQQKVNYSTQSSYDNNCVSQNYSQQTLPAEPLYGQQSFAPPVLPPIFPYKEGLKESKSVLPTKTTAPAIRYSHAYQNLWKCQFCFHDNKAESHTCTQCGEYGIQYAY